MTSLRLFLTTNKDLPKVLEIENASENKPFIGAFSLERHQQVIEQADELHLCFKMHEKLIGYAILQGLKNSNDAIELKRITITEKGKGHGRSALQLIKLYCFEELNCHRLWLDVFDFNERALHLYRSEGFIEEGIIRECIKREDGFKNLVLMSILKPEYELLIKKRQ